MPKENSQLLFFLSFAISLGKIIAPNIAPIPQAPE